MSKYVGAKPGEVFLGNRETAKGIPSYLAGLKTLRLGDKALDIDGHDLPDHRPMFISSAEAPAYDRIMMKRLSETAMGVRHADANPH